MKVDFHLHTLSSVPNGDAIKWHSLRDTIKILWSHKISAFAFTDHNCFNATQYIEAKKLVNGKMYIFPGVEADILTKRNEIANLIILFDSLLTDAQIRNLEKICNEKLRKKGVRIDMINEIFKEYKLIKIPHVGKSNYFTPKELNEFEYDAIEISNEKHFNYLKWKRENKEKSILSFSDTHIWSEYPQQHGLTTEIPFDGTFLDLKNKLNENKVFIKE